MGETNAVFLWIEKKMNIFVPVYIKNILKCCGYDNCHTISTIVDADIEYFTDEVRKGSVNKFYHGKISEAAIMEGCATSVENFVFSRGHIKLLQAIVKIVKDTLEVHGAGGFLIKLHKVSSTVLSKEENITSKAASSNRKRFKFSTVTSAQVDVEPADESSINDIAQRTARSTLIRKAIVILITHTPNLFANVSIF